MKSQRQHLGAYGENLALRHYLDNGAEFLDRNVSYDCGEIDIIVRTLSGSIAFVEVKTRRGEEFGAAEAVDRRKIRRMRHAAAKWLDGKPFVPVQFDVVTVIVDPPSGDSEITVFEDVEHGSW